MISIMPNHLARPELEEDVATLRRKAGEKLEAFKLLMSQDNQIGKQQNKIR